MIVLTSVLVIIPLAKVKTVKKGVKMLSIIAAVAVLPLFAIASVIGPRQGANQITINFDKKYQTIDGFGFSEAFQRANNIVNRTSS